ncbi:hypothetical protein [Zoogloea sp.]|uniref:hypothetical protein n=1 Tax=Zoogloea sp. TaxID=49181 RepID=UPI0014169E61|nr:MAG: hypothetical protein F9K15_08260 [Zoogloea sp.]
MDGLSEGWLQFLFVAVPVLSLVGTWMGLRTAGRLAERRRVPAADEQDDKNNGGNNGRSDPGLE